MTFSQSGDTRDHCLDFSICEFCVVSGMSSELFFVKVVVCNTCLACCITTQIIHCERAPFWAARFLKRWVSAAIPLCPGAKGVFTVAFPKAKNSPDIMSHKSCSYSHIISSTLKLRLLNDDSSWEKRRSCYTSHWFLATYNWGGLKIRCP